MEFREFEYQKLSKVMVTVFKHTIFSLNKEKLIMKFMKNQVFKFLETYGPCWRLKTVC